MLMRDRLLKQPERRARASFGGTMERRLSGEIGAAFLNVLKLLGQESFWEAHQTRSSRNEKHIESRSLRMFLVL